MIGKFFHAFSNDWKTFSETNGPVFGLSSGFANGMRLEGDFPERKWKRRKSAREVTEERFPGDGEGPPLHLRHHFRRSPPPSLVNENVGLYPSGIRI